MANDKRVTKSWNNMPIRFFFNLSMKGGYDIFVCCTFSNFNVDLQGAQYNNNGILSCRQV